MFLTFKPGQYFSLIWAPSELDNIYYILLYTLMNGWLPCKLMLNIIYKTEWTLAENEEKRDFLWMEYRGGGGVEDIGIQFQIICLKYLWWRIILYISEFRGVGWGERIRIKRPGTHKQKNQSDFLFSFFSFCPPPPSFYYNYLFNT